jgi:hypothetical protein
MRDISSRSLSAQLPSSLHVESELHLDVDVVFLRQQQGRGARAR